MRILKDNSRNTIIFLWDNGFWFESIECDIIHILWEQVKNIRSMPPGKHVMNIQLHDRNIFEEDDQGPVGYTFWFEKCIY